ncbi:hypothetical protein H2200_001920 [Cladophialophora chaetospira]|uniref:Uncharacterized protein n=1 Tax=Cladophialophora chaetospira TaxID=386627 RepID=A0AA38XLX6_9EURO|nr:hypothetical protein H2200_001920 [Cladophialophora chaetospira]
MLDTSFGEYPMQSLMVCRQANILPDFVDPNAPAPPKVLSQPDVSGEEEDVKDAGGSERHHPRPKLGEQMTRLDA